MISSLQGCIVKVFGVVFLHILACVWCNIRSTIESYLPERYPFLNSIDVLSNSLLFLRMSIRVGQYTDILGIPAEISL